MLNEAQSVKAIRIIEKLSKQLEGVYNDEGGNVNNNPDYVEAREFLKDVKKR